LPRSLLVSSPTLDTAVVVRDRLAHRYRCPEL